MAPVGVRADVERLAHMSAILDQRFRTIGYDLRAPWRDRWTTDMRRWALLDESIARPLSIDHEAWPSPDVANALRGSRYALYWQDLDVLVRELTPLIPDDVAHGDQIMVQAIEGAGRPAVWSTRGAFVDPIASSGGASFELLGHDVADEWSASGLNALSCCFDPREKPALQREYAHHLNAHGLFDDTEVALRYCKIADARTPAHAPYFVYRLWRRRR